MDYGLSITNPAGKILVDGERRMPKLYAHERVYLSTQGHDSTVGYTQYHDFNFAPTKKPLFITQAIDETAPYDEFRLLRTPYLYRNTSGEYYKARLEALGRVNGRGKIWVFVWVYEV